MAKSAGGKKAKGSPPIDADFFASGRFNKEMYDSQYAKFFQNPELATVLKATKEAKLMHHSRGSEPVFFENLVKIRSLLL